MILVGLGWAYVPINPSALRPNPRKGHMIVAAAGPISNLILAFICALLWQAFNSAVFYNPTLVSSAANILFSFAWINIALFLFNLVPIAPLDGFFVLKGLLPYEAAYRLEGIQRYGMIIFLVVFFLLPIIGFPILDWLIFIPASRITQLLF